MPVSAKKNMTQIFAAFLLCGILHVLLYGVPFTDGFSQLFCGAVVLTWGISVKKRVTDQRLMHLLLAMAGFLLLYLILQLSRFSFFDDNITVERYLWYAYYIPTEAFPVLCFYLAVFIHRPENKPLRGVLWLPLIIGILLALGMLTNDLHFWAKSFPDGIMIDRGNEKNGWLFYLITVYTYLMFGVSFLILWEKSRQFKGQRFRWLPLAPFLVGIIYFILYYLHIGQRLFGMRVWNMGEMYVFCLVAALEACILTGLIPANTEYEKLFIMTGFPAVILDKQNHVKYASDGTVYPFPKSDNVQVMRHPISGGRVEWALDISQLHKLNQELVDATQRIDARNTYLSEETKIMAQKAELETRNRIYDDITRIVRPQLDRISAMMDSSDEDFTARLKKIAVLSAYIKRRSNMELHAEDGRLSSEELMLAAMESMDYGKLCGISTAISSSGSENYPAALVVDAYEQMEAVIEDCLEYLTFLMISLKAEKNTLQVRMMLEGEKLPETVRILPSSPGVTRTVSDNRDGQECMFCFLFREGGEAE